MNQQFCFPLLPVIMTETSFNLFIFYRQLFFFFKRLCPGDRRSLKVVHLTDLFVMIKNVQHLRLKRKTGWVEESDGVKEDAVNQS